MGEGRGEGIARRRFTIQITGIHFGFAPDAGEGGGDLVLHPIDETPVPLHQPLLGYQVQPLTRAYRVGQFNFRDADWLNAMPPKAREVVTALANQFAMAGTDALESRDVFATPEIIRAGGLAALRQVGEPSEVLKETKRRILTP